LSLKFFVCFYTWPEDDKSDVEFGPLVISWSLKVFQVWWCLLSLLRSYEYDDLHIVWWCKSLAYERCHFLLIQDIDFWLIFFEIFYHSLLSFFGAYDALIHVQYNDGCIIWYCTLKQISVYLIVLQYFVIIKTLEELHKTLLVPTYCNWSCQKIRMSLFCQIQT